MEPSQAESWVTKQVAQGADFIKLVAESPGLGQDILTAAAKASKKAKRAVVCHASSYNSVGQALVAGVDQVHHVPLDKPLDIGAVLAYVRQSTISVPTLAMMLAISKSGLPGYNFAASNTSVSLLHALGVPILAGTDANTLAKPSPVPFGSSLHEELELLVSAGLSPLEALQAATSVPARVWGLHDRGVVKVGKRADLVLVEGDPTKNISATRNIRKVWIAGQEVR
jgi:imidazolonepropionase-like amidohydrolase